jgi:signal transduction histidine kinase
MRQEQANALDDAAARESVRAHDIAGIANASFDRLAAAGRSFADGGTPETPGLKNAALFDSSGVWGRVLHGSALDFPDLPEGWFQHARYANALIGADVMAFSYGDRVVAIYFDRNSLVPPSLLHDADLVTPDGAPIEGRPLTYASTMEGTRADRWPVLARAAVDEEAVLSEWNGRLPLYLFSILSPVVVGILLSFLFIAEFEKRTRASTRAARALRTVRPLEARLLVRLAAAERSAHEASRAKAEFIAHMSHELRTPLNAIIGFSEIISKSLFGPTGHPKYVEYAEDIVAAGRGLHEKIGDILEYANVEAGRYPLRFSLFDLNALACACVGEHQGHAFSGRIALAMSVSAPVEARADKSAVTRIASILINDALDRTGERGSVRVEVSEDDGAAVLRVSRERTRDRKDRTTASDVGLGLALAAALARRMGGALVIGDAGATELRLPKGRAI